MQQRRSFLLEPGSGYSRYPVGTYEVLSIHLRKVYHMTTPVRLAYCVDCEWTGKQSEVTMKWGQRRCPKCGSRRVELRAVGAIEATVDDYELMTRLAGDLSGAEL